MKPTSNASSPRAVAGVLLRTAATFVIMSFMWTFYTAWSLDDVVLVWSHAGLGTVLWGTVVVAAIVVATVFFEVLPGWQTQTRQAGKLCKPFAVMLQNDMLHSVLPLLALVLLASPLVQSQMDEPLRKRVQAVVSFGDSKVGSSAARDRGYMANKTFFESLLRQELPEPELKDSR